jgi:hypothetical protein
LLQLAGQFDRVWYHPAADHRIRKRLVRLLIEEIIATVNEAEPSIDLVIHWKGGKHTALKIAKNRTGQHSRATQREVVEVVRELARRLPDGQIARILNRLGYQTGVGNGFTANRVVTLRNYHGIEVYNSDAAAPGVTIEQAAAMLGVSTGTVRRMIHTGIIEARQPVAYAPWAIDPAILSNEAVKRAVDAIRSGGKLPRTAPVSQLNLIKSGT